MELNCLEVTINKEKYIIKKMRSEFRKFKIKILKEPVSNSIYIKLAILLLFTLTVVNFSYDSGVTHIIYKDVNRKREFSTIIFYPAITKDDDEEIVIGENPVFIGNKFKKSPMIAPKKFPLIIFIHGSGGNNTSMSYLAAELASRGIIVVAANHLSETKDDSPAETVSVKPWVQNEDVSFLLDEILKDSNFNKNILPDSIGVIGYSKGAYTALALAGGELKLDKYVDYCSSNSKMPDCIFYNEDFLKEKINFEKSYLDNRFSFIISIDPIFSLAFDNESLKRIQIPILLISSEYYYSKEPDINLYGESLYKQLNKTKTTYKLIENSGHFDFLPLCKKEALEILKMDGEGEEIICISSKKSRVEIHKETVDSVLKFLKDINIIKN